MKNLLLLLMVGLFAACNESALIKIQVNEPVLMSEAEFRNSVRVTNEHIPLKNPGKICFYNGYLYISEPGEGIHIIDNRNPKNPANAGFIELKGNADVAVKNDLLYADALIDLVWFDITNPAKPEFKGRLEDVFPDAYPSPDNQYSCDYSSAFTADGKRTGLITGWKLTKRRVSAERIDYTLEGAYANKAATSGGTSSTGTNGSMARFALYDKYLYTVINYRMQIFDISSDKPVKILFDETGNNNVYDDGYYNGELYVGNVETVFSYKDNMFLGSPTGMSIYSVKNPTRPTRCATIQHVLGCDPVVVDDDLAYVTVHSGNFCGQNNDELFIVNVKDVYHPKQLVSFTMENPKGLGIDGDKKTLFLCDDGLKVYKIGDDPQKLVANQLAHIKGMDGFDLIPYENVLMMIADDGLYQYDYSDMKNIRKLSVIPIGKTKN